ncbi:MAG: STAS domain-containing protein [Planctomycetes bacterium]|nr:STAS domain-containing protein [Planctomycetota bacterium]
MSNRTPDVSQQDGVTVIALGPEYENLDEHLLDELQRSILAVVDEAKPPRIVLDLSHTQFFGSAFIEVLFRAWNRINSREGGRFSVSGLTPYCAEVVSITHLDQLWQIHKSKEEAVAAFKD